jgi:hypothetical protein
VETLSRHDWARPIVFEGVELPGTVFAIDHLGKEPELSVEASEWIWRFTVCVGVMKRDSSENIIRYAGEALDVATRFRERLLCEMPVRFDGPFDEQVLREWVYSLLKMIEIAASRSFCAWTSPHAAGGTQAGG